jgi:hypothetical protein
MAESPHLPDEILSGARKLLDNIRAELVELSRRDATLLHHTRRYIMKRLEFDERSRPSDRKDVKLTLMAKQQGKCAICGEPLPGKGSELDRNDPVLGYTEANCKLVHHECHRAAQAAKNFS